MNMTFCWDKFYPSHSCMDMSHEVLVFTAALIMIVTTKF
uniref:Uncharacterized protein n=1 Tax=Arundo donax TaxID=35708 RepID=A0A0A9GX52_ARUDO